MFYAELKSPLAFLRLPNEYLCFSLVGSRPCDRSPQTQNITLAPQWMTLSRACARQEVFVFSLHSFTNCAQSVDVEFVWGEGFWFLPSPSAVSVRYSRAFEPSFADKQTFRADRWRQEA